LTKSRKYDILYNIIIYKEKCMKKMKLGTMPLLLGVILSVAFSACDDMGGGGIPTDCVI
jgi:hypothetical protein